MSYDCVSSDHRPLCFSSFRVREIMWTCSYAGDGSVRCTLRVFQRPARSGRSGREQQDEVVREQPAPRSPIHRHRRQLQTSATRLLDWQLT